jgi:hypothetical protein
MPTSALATATALTTATGTLALVALLPLWPFLAPSLLARRTSVVGYLLADAALCLGPLCVPLLVLLAALGVHAAWTRRAEARPLCAAALGGWVGALAVTLLVIAP